MSREVLIEKFKWSVLPWIVFIAIITGGVMYCLWMADIVIDVILNNYCG